MSRTNLVENCTPTPSDSSIKAVIMCHFLNLTGINDFNNMDKEITDALGNIGYTKKGALQKTYIKLMDKLPAETEMRQMHNEIRKAIGGVLKLENRLNYFKEDPYKKVTYSVSFIFKPPADDVDMSYLEALFDPPGDE